MKSFGLSTLCRGPNQMEKENQRGKPADPDAAGK